MRPFDTPPGCWTAAGTEMFGRRRLFIIFVSFGISRSSRATLFPISIYSFVYRPLVDEKKVEEEECISQG